MRLFLSFLLAACMLFAESPLVGTWRSTIDFGDEVVYLSLIIKEEPTGLSASMVNAVNGKQVLVDSIKFGDRKIELAIPTHGGKYVGTVVGGTINGYWTIGNKGVPLNFQRSDKPVVTISQAEREFAVSYLEKTRKEFEDSISGLTPAQWNYKPSSGGWSIAECAEHIATGEDLIFNLVVSSLLKPADPEAARTGREQDARIITGMTDRSKKGKAPEVLKPTGKYPTPESVVSAFDEKRDRSVAFVKLSQDDLRGRITPNRSFGTVDAYQYILFMAAHSSRHTAQLNDVKADAGYPK
ncbi:MAG: DinB family protein [Bryobacteraceae bacterium]